MNKLDILVVMLLWCRSTLCLTIICDIHSKRKNVNWNKVQYGNIYNQVIEKKCEIPK